jgi:hypothetical protein
VRPNLSPRALVVAQEFSDHVLSASRAYAILGSRCH